MAQYKQCPQGHYFDPAIYNTCPYCTDVNRRSSGGLESQVTVPVNYQNDVPRSNNTAAASDNGPVSAAEAENSGTSVSVSGTANTIGGITVPAPVIKRLIILKQSQKKVKIPTRRMIQNLLSAGWSLLKALIADGVLNFITDIVLSDGNREILS